MSNPKRLNAIHLTITMFSVIIVLSLVLFHYCMKSPKMALPNFNTSTQRDNWWMMGGSPTHSSYTSANGPVDPQVLWKKKIGIRSILSNSLVFSSPSMSSTGNVYLTTTDGALCCLDYFGRILWQRDGIDGTASSVAISINGLIVFGDNSGALYAFASNGIEEWRFKADGSITSSPAISNNSIIFGTSKGTLYCLDINGSLQWNMSYADSQNALSPAVMSNGKIVNGLHQGLLTCVDSRGNEQWLYDTGMELSASPSLDLQNNIYIGSNSGWLLAFRPDGTLKWKQQLNSSILTSAAVSDRGIVYVGTKRGLLYALNSEGEVMWSYCTPHRIGYSSPCVDINGNIFIGTDDGFLIAIDNTGSAIWEMQLDNAIISSPMLDIGGNIVIATLTTVYMVGDK